MDNTQEFRISALLRLMLVSGIVLFGGGFFGSIALLLFMPNISRILWLWVLVILGYGALVVLFIREWKRRNYLIRTSSEGIAAYPSNSEVTYIRWQDIATIRESSVLERLMVVDKNNKSLTVGYGIDRPNEFLRVLIANLAHLANEYCSFTQFHRTPHVHAFLLGAFVFTVLFATLALFSIGYFYAAFFFAFGLLVVVVMLFEFTGVQLGDKSITIRFPLWRKTVNLSRISNLTIEVTSDTKGKSGPCVLLTLSNGKVIKLFGLREGTIALYIALNHRLKSVS